MRNLDISMFTQGLDDAEAARYRIMAALDARAMEFNRTRLYPYLSELIELAKLLEGVMENGAHFSTSVRRSLSGIDMEQGKLLFHPDEHDEGTVTTMFELIEASLPNLRNLITEGMALFDFVSENMKIDSIGIVPIYRNEGYVFVPDLRDGVVHILRYQLSLFTAEDQQYRTLKTVEFLRRELSVIQEAPENVKLELVKDYSDMPNPATYMCDVEIDFPFEATVMPVAKRKLMRYLAS